MPVFLVYPIGSMLPSYRLSTHGTRAVNSYDYKVSVPVQRTWAVITLGADLIKS